MGFALGLITGVLISFVGFAFLVATIGRMGRKED